MILASASPQRSAILTQLGVRFEVRASGAEELTDGPPHELVVANARRKAQTVAAGDPDGGSGAPVLGVDTIVVYDGRIYGKPSDAAAARATLRTLAGQTHTVISGLCIVGGVAAERTAVAETAVEFRTLRDAEIEAYIETGEWRERAGGYAIQGRGALLVSAIRGDYLNVVGLPVAALVALAPELLEV